MFGIKYKRAGVLVHLFLIIFSTIIVMNCKDKTKVGDQDIKGNAEQLYSSSSKYKFMGYSLLGYEETQRTYVDNSKLYSSESSGNRLIKKYKNVLAHTDLLELHYIKSNGHYILIFLNYTYTTLKQDEYNKTRSLVEKEINRNIINNLNEYNLENEYRKETHYYFNNDNIVFKMDIPIVDKNDSGKQHYFVEILFYHTVFTEL